MEAVFRECSCCLPCEGKAEESQTVRGKILLWAICSIIVDCSLNDGNEGSDDVLIRGIGVRYFVEVP